MIGVGILSLPVLPLCCSQRRILHQRQVRGQAGLTLLRNKSDGTIWKVQNILDLRRLDTQPGSSSSLAEVCKRFVTNAPHWHRWRLLGHQMPLDRQIPLDPQM